MNNIIFAALGGLAQLARALHWQCRGHRFDSDILHKFKPSVTSGGLFSSMTAAFVYIIFSDKWNQYYVGSTQNLEARLETHNAGKNKSTKGGAPWFIKYTEECSDATQARKREYAIKKKKSRKYLEWLISNEH